MTIVIIDDSLSDIEYCKELLVKNFNNFDKLECFNDPHEGLKYLNEHRPELLIVDMEMPELSGLELLKGLKSPKTEILFHTAHASFAIDAYRNFALGFY